LAFRGPGRSVGIIEGINAGKDRIQAGMPVRIKGVERGKICVEGMD